MSNISIFQVTEGITSPEINLIFIIIYYDNIPLRLVSKSLDIINVAYQ